MQTRLPLAVIGCGYWGSKHVRVVHQTPSLQMALAVDSRQPRLDYIAAQYPGVDTARDFEAALKSDVAGIIIATPISTHYPLAKAALLAGKHVLIEKPMATTAAHCRELIKLAEERDLVLMVGHTFEYHPAVEMMRTIVQQGRIGELYYVSSRRLNLGLYQTDVNVLWDLAPHDLSIIFSFIDSEVETVNAWGNRHVLPHTEDVVYMRTTHSDGLAAHIHVSWLDPAKVRQLTVVGSEGMIVFDDVLPEEKVKIYEKRFKPVATGDSFADFQAAYRHGNVFVPELPSGEPLQIEIMDFAKAIKTGSQPRANGQSGLRVVEALERASQSLLLSATPHAARPHATKKINGNGAEATSPRLEIR